MIMSLTHLLHPTKAVLRFVDARELAADNSPQKKNAAEGHDGERWIRGRDSVEHREREMQRPLALNRVGDHENGLARPPVTIAPIVLGKALDLRVTGNIPCQLGCVPKK